MFSKMFPPLSLATEYIILNLSWNEHIDKNTKFIWDNVLFSFLFFSKLYLSEKQRIQLKMERLVK